MSLRFAARPGTHERHLARRHANPLFSEARRRVSEADVEAARARDQAESAQFAQDFQALLEQAVALAPNSPSETVLRLKARCDQLLDICAALGGDLGGTDSAAWKGLLKLNQVIMASVRRAAGDDALAQSELDDEQAARDIHLRLLGQPLVADLLRPDSPIAADELPAALLCQSAAAVRQMCVMFDAEQRQAVAEQAESLLQDLRTRSGDVPALKLAPNLEPELALAAFRDCAD